MLLLCFMIWAGLSKWSTKHPTNRQVRIWQHRYSHMQAIMSKKSVKSQVRFCPTAKNPLPAHLAGSCIRRISAAETVGAAVQAICVTGRSKRKIKVFSVKEQKNENR